MYVATLTQSVMVCSEVVVDRDRKEGEMMFVEDHRLCQPVATRFRRAQAMNGSVRTRAGEMKKIQGTVTYDIKGAAGR